MSGCLGLASGNGKQLNRQERSYWNNGNVLKLIYGHGCLLGKFLFKDFLIFLFDRQITSRQRGRQREREEEAGSLPTREPDAGLDPRTPRS